MIYKFQTTLSLAILLVVSSIANSQLSAQQAERSTSQNYLANLAAANSALRLNEVTEAKRWLDEIPQPSRAWEWHLLNARTDSSTLRISTGAWSPVRLDVSHVDSQIVVACTDGNVRIYDAETLQSVSEWKVADQALYAARFSPDGKKLAVCARDGQLSLWNVMDSTKLWSQISGGEGLADIAFRPDGQQLLFCSWFRRDRKVLGTLSTWDVTTGKQSWTTEFGVKPIVTARYSPDGKYFAVGTWDALVELWSAASPGEPKVFDFADQPQYSAIDDIAFSPNSKMLAAATKNGTPRIWTLDGSVSPVDMGGHANAVFSIAFSTDGKSLLSGGSDGVLAVWDIARRTLSHRLLGHTNRIVSIAHGHQSNSIVTASADQTLRIWNLDQAKSFEAPEAGKFAYGMVVADEGKRLVTGGQSETIISVWDSKTKDAVRHFEGTSSTVNFLDGDGHNWVAGGNWNGDVVIWDIQSGNAVHRMGSKELGGMQQCALSDDRKWLASATNKNQVVVWNAETGALSTTIPFAKGCWGIAFSEDGQFLAVGDGGGNVHWISTNNWQTLWSCSAGSSQVNALRIAKSGKWLAAGTEAGVLTLIDIEQLSVRHQVQAHSERIWSLDISPDEQRVVTGSSDRKVKTWDPVSGVSLLTIADFTSSVYNVQFSPDGRVLYVNSLGSQIVRLSIE